ncbi:survival motor neuron interacting protein 1-domain-containing protein [Syncephalis fuscata]|nr:survival motor neuron interacting protein 1-domain-containing protein [Syncephalis fuscata]
MKRKRGQRKRASEDTDTYNGRAVLPVATHLTNPDGPPATGEEYLWLVRKEAEKCPDIVAASRVEEPTSSSTVDPALRPARWRVPTETATATSTKQFLQPNSNWKVSFLATFAKNRQRLQTYRANHKNGEALDIDIHSLPKANNEMGWLKFCYGDSAWLLYSEAVEEEEGEVEEEEEEKEKELFDTLDIENDTEALEEVETNDNINNIDADTDIKEEQVNNNKKALDQNENALQLAKDRLLASLNSLIEPLVTSTQTIFNNNENSASTNTNDGVDPSLSFIAHLSQKYGQWLYALLLRVDAVLTSSEMAVLRSVCRGCHAIRNQITCHDDPRLIIVNMIIAIIAEHFGQRDLAY